MRILLYGFGPYKQFEDNITQRVVKKLPRSANLKKIVFPVRFDKSQFVSAIKKHRPEIVLGLGQCSSGRSMRIERRAVNRRRNEKGEKGRPIVRGGAKRLAITLRLEQSAFGKSAKISRNAGDYVCNFSMYVILDYLRCHRCDSRFGFIHVPHDYNRKRAERLVRNVLRSLDARSGGRRDLKPSR
jgi:pyroglutamyl-peptidase